MSTPVRPTRRMLNTLQRRMVRARPGSVLIMVVALLVLMALMGTAYITSARVDRYSAQQNSFNTEVDLLLKAVVEMEQDKISSASNAPTDAAVGSSYHNWNSPSDEDWWGSRVPVRMASNQPGWRYIAVSPTGAPFESPYGVNGTVVTYANRQNLQPDYIDVNVAGQLVRYPALLDIATGKKYLAASASGDGIADAGLWRIPIGELNGVTYFAAVRVLDNSSAINASVADARNPVTASLPGDFFPANVDLQSLLVGGGAEMGRLDVYRCNGAAPSMQPLDDNGNPLSFQFGSPYDALWHQLGRRLDNPGLNTVGTRYQALPATDSTALAYRFCLANPSASPSVVEQALQFSLLNASNPNFVPTSPYSPDQVAQWYRNNFAYENEVPGSPNTYLPRRAITAARTPVSNYAPNRYNYKGDFYSHPNTTAVPPQKPWDATVAYTFGDWVRYDGRSYICIRENSGAKGAGTNLPVGATGSFTSTDENGAPIVDANGAPVMISGPVSQMLWAPMPWNNYPVRTSVNTASFAQLWPAFWNVMCETQTSVPAGTDTAMFRNPMRSSVTVAAAPAGGPAGGGTSSVAPSGGDDTAAIQAAINSSAPGATISFAGSYRVSSTINFLPDRTYTGGPGGGGAAIPGLTPTETMLLRSALASVNAEQIRLNPSASTTLLDVISRSVSFGNLQVQAGPASSGGATWTWAGGKASAGRITGHGAIVTGINFVGSGIIISKGDSVHVEGCSFDGITTGSAGTNALVVTGITNSKIAFNHFTNQTKGTGLYVFNPSTTQFDDNTFDQVFQAMHMLFYNHGAGISVSRNVIQHCTRHGIELQSSPQGLTVDGNWIDNWNPHIDPQHGNDSHMGISCATAFDKGMDSHNVRVTNNYVGGHGITRDFWAMSAIELGGNGIVCSGNYAYNWGQGELVGPCSNWTSSNNTWVKIKNPRAMESGGTQPSYGSGDRWFADLNSPGCPPIPPKPSGAPSTTPGPPVGGSIALAYTVSVFGSAPQPYITEVYADDTPSSANGYIAVELFNPYNFDISMNNWRLATISRPQSGASSLVPTPIASTIAWQSNPPVIKAGGRLLLVSSDTPPSNVSNPPKVDSNSSMLVVPDLISAFDQELVLLRPRRADGVLWWMTANPADQNATNPAQNHYDPSNLYDERTNLGDFVPLDSYDFTGLYPKTDATTSAQWHYIRPNDPAAHKAWHFVYPGKYTSSSTGAGGTNTTTGNQPRLVGTMVMLGNQSVDLSSLGQPDAASANPANYQDFPIQVNNTDFGGAKMNAYPMGGFARNGDMLQVTYVGSYTIKLSSNSVILEMNPITMDSAFADDVLPADDTAENIGRFVPIHPGDLTPPSTVGNPAAAYDDYSTDASKWTPYHFSMRFFDFLSVQAPHDDYLPNTSPVNPDGSTNTSVTPVANANPKIINALLTNNPLNSTEDNVPLEGLININTAPWRVLSALPMSSNPAVNAQLAQAIVNYRDVNDGTGKPHGPFKTIWELNAVIGQGATANFRNTLSGYAGNYDPATSAPVNTDGYLTPFAGTTAGGSNQGGFVYNDFETQNLALTRISNLVTTRSDAFTVYVLVQGFRNAGTANPELVVQRHAAFIADRSRIIPTNPKLTIMNVPTN